MDARRVKELVAEWADEAGDRVGDSTKARVALQQALASLVSDDAPAAVLIDDDAVPRVGAVVGSRLLLASGSADEGTEPTANCEALALSAETQVSVTYTVRRAEASGLYSRRRWTVVPRHGDPVSFYTASPDPEGANTPFVRALAEALGWTLPDS
jgi:hypothetical protein